MGELRVFCKFLQSYILIIQKISTHTLYDVYNIDSLNLTNHHKLNKKAGDVLVIPGTIRFT